MRLRGGPELMARLSSVVAAKPQIQRAWAEDASGRISHAAPRRTGRLANSVAPGERQGKGVVTGLWYGVILDRGTKSYGIEPRKAGGTLRFTYRGRTIFAKKVQRRRLRRRPFATQGAQEALRAAPVAREIVRAYSRVRSGGRRSSLAL